MKRRSKKSETLDIRLPHDQKEAFMQATRRRGETASEALRRYIARYITETEAKGGVQPLKEIAMTVRNHPAKTTGGFAALATSLAAAFAVFAAPSVADNNAQPKNNPDVVYPLDLIEKGISGTCEVRFDVSANGFVEPGAMADCTHPGFVSAAESAVYTLEFEPLVVDGKSVRREDVIYPFSFELYSESEVRIDGPEREKPSQSSDGTREKP